MVKRINISTSLLLFALMIYFLMFDYKSESGASKFLVVFAGIASLFSGLLLVIKVRYINNYALPLISVTFLFIIGAFLSGIIHGQTIYDVVSLSIPLLLFLVALVGTSAIKINLDNIKILLNIVIIFLLLSVFFKLIFGFIYYNLSMENVRYQIISPTIILLFSYGLASVLFKKQKFGNIALILAILVAFISVTRSFLIVFFAVGLFWLFAYRLNYWIKNIKFIFKLLLLLIFIIVSVYLFFPDVFDRWILRLFTVEEKGVDITYVTRIAEASYQINKLLETPINLIAGMGIAAETRFAPEFQDILSTVFSADFEYKGKGFGHNTYIGIIFTGGLFLGGLFIYFLLRSVIKTITFLRKSLRKNHVLSDYYFLIGWGGSSALGYCVYSLLGGTFGDRLGSLSFGLSFGLIFLGKRFVLQNEK